MTRNWQRLSLATVLLGALLVAPLPAADSDNPPKDKTAPAATTADVLAELQKLAGSLTKLTDRLDSLERNLGRDMVDQENKRMRTEVTAQTAMRDVNELKEQIAQLRKDLDALNKRLGPTTQSSFYGPSAVPPATGRVRLVNTYFTPQTIIINGQAFEVGPNQVRTETVPAGAFSYEVVSVQPRQDRLLAANETITITVHPR